MTKKELLYKILGSLKLDLGGQYHKMVDVIILTANEAFKEQWESTPIEEAIKDKEDELMPFNEVVTNYWGYATNEAIKQYPDDLQRQVSYREGIFKGLSKSNQKEAISEEAIRNAYQMGWTDRENKLSDGMFNPKEDEDNYMALLKSTKA